MKSVSEKNKMAAENTREGAEQIMNFFYKWMFLWHIIQHFYVTYCTGEGDEIGIPELANDTLVSSMISKRGVTEMTIWWDKNRFIWDSVRMSIWHTEKLKKLKT
jgi:hypothetical protein